METLQAAEVNRKVVDNRNRSVVMEFSEFEHQIFTIDKVIHQEFFKNRGIGRNPQATNSNVLRLVVRRAAEDLVLCTDVEQGINRLKAHPEAWSNIIALTIDAPLARDNHRAAARRAFEATAREPNALPFYPYCFYLLELCSELDRADDRSRQTTHRVQGGGKRSSE
jgi:hypothetical protein